jgi:N-acetyl sugar amidotransferase
MDTSAEGIVFDQIGQCNFCKNFSQKIELNSESDKFQKSISLEKLIKKVKSDGQGKDYDCIIGVSGGVDSSWALLKAVELGLRPLAVHLDNGWDSELAQNNISNLVNTLKVDLYTDVIEWEEYKALMNSFFKAHVIDVELLYDNAMLAANFEQAKKFGLHFILSGSNTVTEGMRIPKNWNWYKLDWKNIKAISHAFEKTKIESFPHISTLQFFVNSYIKQIKWTQFLDYLDYDKKKAIKELEDKVNYRPYPYKHYESIFTRFYQGYILPKKFNVDKRRVHLSTLIISGGMSREEAIQDLLKIPYNTQHELDDDINYFVKKLGWTIEDLNNYLAKPAISHHEFSSEIKIYNFLRFVYNLFKIR